MDKVSEINEAQHKIERYEAYKRLVTNSDDFRKLIFDDYLNKYTLNLIYNQANAINISEIQDELLSISHFKQYLESLEVEADNAKEFLENVYK